MERSNYENEFLQRFGEQLRQYRLANNLTQEELAIRAGFSRSYYTEIETGKRNISLLNLNKLSVCFGITLSELLDMK